MLGLCLQQMWCAAEAQKASSGLPGAAVAFIHKSFVVMLWKQVFIPFTPFFSLFEDNAASVTWHRYSILHLKSHVSHVCIVPKWRTGKIFTNSIRHWGERIRSRSSVNTLCLSSHSTSTPMAAESVMTVGFSIVNICLTCQPASLGDCPAFSLPGRSCCSN